MARKLSCVSCVHLQPLSGSLWLACVSYDCKYFLCLVLWSVWLSIPNIGSQTVVKEQISLLQTQLL